MGKGFLIAVKLVPLTLPAGVFYREPVYCTIIFPATDCSPPDSR
jgi:hypothetical protein